MHHNKLLRLKYWLYGLPEFTMFNTVIANVISDTDSSTFEGFITDTDSSTFEGFFLFGIPGFSSDRYVLYIYIYDLVPKGVQEKRTEVRKNKVDRMWVSHAFFLMNTCEATHQWREKAVLLFVPEKFDFQCDLWQDVQCCLFLDENDKSVTFYYCKV